MEKIFTKKDDSTLIVTKQVRVEEETNEYNLDFLKEQERSIIKRREDVISSTDAELADIQELISEAEKLGVKTAEEIKEIKKEEDSNKKIDNSEIKL